MTREERNAIARLDIAARVECPHYAGSGLELEISDILARAAAPPSPQPPAKEQMNGGWRYSINYGPDGEENYAFVYDAGNYLVGNFKTHHAKAVVARMSAPPPSQSYQQEAVAWVWYGRDEANNEHVSLGRWAKHPCQSRYKLAEIQPTEHDHPPPSYQQGIEDAAKVAQRLVDNHWNRIDVVEAILALTETGQ